jgi:hypothetical protein
MRISTAPDPGPPANAVWKLAQAAIVVAILAFTWLPEIRMGFWVDEAGTFWMARAGWREAISRTIEWPGQSVAYSVLASLFARPGDPHFEIWMRIPTLIAAAMAGFLLYRMASGWFGQGTAWLALAVAASSPQIARASTEARPYIIAVAFALAGILFFVHWLEHKRAWPAAAAGLCFAAMLHFHLLFAALLLAPAIWLAGDVWTRRQLPWRQLLLGLAVMALGCLPLVPVVRVLLAKADLARDSVGYFSIEQLIQALCPSGLAAAFLIAWIAALASRPENGDTEEREAAGQSHFRRVFVWWLAPAVAFWAAAKLSGSSANSRYFLYATPAFALVLASLARRLDADRVTGLMAIMAVLVLAQNHAAPAARNDCAKIYRAVAARPEGTSAPVVIQSMLVESIRLDWREPSNSAPHLHACLDSYPLPNPKLFLPLTFDSEVEAEIQRLAAGPLSGKWFYALGAPGFQGGARVMERLEDAAVRRGYSVKRQAYGALRLTEFIPAAN